MPGMQGTASGLLGHLRKIQSLAVETLGDTQPGTLEAGRIHGPRYATLLEEAPQGHETGAGMKKDDDMTILLIIATVITILFIAFVLVGEQLLPEVWQILLIP